ncbi:hypothetical protein, partial [Streptomyces sp. SID5910]|uniref:hypothetical protein n=1 Tax=Streptomyces sp. SID5910 TaxID=2690312 RepID=UPI0013AA4A11
MIRDVERAAPFAVSRRHLIVLRIVTGRHPMTESYPSLAATPSRRTALRAAGGGTLLLGLGLAGCRSAVSESES